MSYQLIDYFTIYAKEWVNLVTEFLRHPSMTCFSVLFVLLLIAWFRFGHRFFIKTALCIVCYSGFLALLPIPEARTF